LTKLPPKVWGFIFLEHSVVIYEYT